MSDINRTLRTTFNAVAAHYHAVRPRYPQALIDDLVRSTQITQRSNVLEIGAGTGIATTQFAPLGCRITALELGPDLTAVATANLSSYPHVEVVCAPFEDWDPLGLTYDLIYAATSWWWLDPAVATPKAARLLGPEGKIAIIAYHHVLGGTTAFFEAVQPLYRKADPTIPADWRPPIQADLQTTIASLTIDGVFGPPVVTRYDFEIDYTGAHYRALLETYSPIIAMPEQDRNELLDGIELLITDRFAGRITKRYQATMVIASPTHIDHG